MERGQSNWRVTSADAERLQELGYEQELKRRFGVFDNFAIGFGTISPVVGLYAVVGLGISLAGGAWVWVLPVALAGQCLLIAVYAQLVAEFPLAGGAYQWPRRLVGGAYGWFSGWVAVCGAAAANTTIAYLGAPWLLTLVDVEPTAHRLVAGGAVIVVAGMLLGAFGAGLLKHAMNAGIVAEAIAMTGVGVVLLLAFREQDLSVLFDTLGAESESGGSVAAALLATLAVGGWVFIGFDACIAAAEETLGASRHVPRALWYALLGVGGLVLLNAFATTLAQPDIDAVVTGEDTDPVTTAVVNSFGSWSTKPFAAVVLIAFLACGTAAQALTARTMYSIARDDVLPGSRVLRRVDRRGTPIGAVIVTAVLALLGLLLGFEQTAIGSLILFGTAAAYATFLLIAIAALVARVRGTWIPAHPTRFGVALNVAAVTWLAFETVNIAWPRESIAGEDAPFYQVWAAPLLLGAIAVTGLAYLTVAKPHRRIGER
jgi:amino acid transporter